MTNKPILMLALLGSTVAFASAAQAGTVICADGTIYHLSGDEITYSVACANHGGIGRSQLPGAGGIQTNTPHPVFPDTSGRGGGRQVSKVRG
ncbi:MAG: hypothetical protein AAF968_11095 [Pseudomonadota bacterium]